MKMIITGIVLTVALCMLGCAPTLPNKSAVQENYSLSDTITFFSVLDCENAQVTAVRQNFTQDYCQVLEGNIKLDLKKENPGLQYDEKNPDLTVRTTLEQIHGGNAAARFFGWLWRWQIDHDGVC